MTAVAFHTSALHRSASLFLSGCFDRKLRLWSLETGRVVAWQAAPAMVTCAAFSPDGRLIVAGLFSGLCLVLAADGLARSDWAAVRDRAAVGYASAAEATAHRTDFLSLGSGLSAYDDEQWRTVASAGITRLLEPLAISGYVVMGAAGLSILNVFVLGLVQRKRERAALRAIGATTRQEQAVVIAHAIVLGLLVAVLGGLGGIGIAYLWSMGSPVFYGVRIHWEMTSPALRSGMLAVLAMVLAAALYPVLHARRLETVEVLRSA